MKYSRSIASTVVLAFAALGTASCSTEFGPVARTAQGEVVATSATAEASESENGIVGASPFEPEHAPIKEDDEIGSSGSSLSTGYFPELGEYVEHRANTKQLDICNDLPTTFFESIEIVETKPKLSGGGDGEGYGPCVASVKGAPEAMEIDFIAVGSLTPDFLRAPNISVAETSFGESIYLEFSELESLQGCSASVQTVEGILSLRYPPSNGQSASEACPAAEHWMRSLLTADGKDKYSG